MTLQDILNNLARQKRVAEWPAQAGAIRAADPQTLKIVKEALLKYPQTQAAVRLREPVGVAVDWPTLPRGSAFRTDPGGFEQVFDTSLRKPDQSNVEGVMSTKGPERDQSALRSTITLRPYENRNRMVRTAAHELTHAIAEQRKREIVADIASGRPVTVAERAALEPLTRASPESIPEGRWDTGAIAQMRNAAEGIAEWGADPFFQRWPESKSRQAEAVFNWTDRSTSRETQRQREVQIRSFMNAITNRGRGTIPSGFGPTP